MYKLRFGNNKERTLYIFKATDNWNNSIPAAVNANRFEMAYGEVPIGSQDFLWHEIVGEQNAVILRTNPEKDNGMFSTIIKQSLEVSLIRTNINDFNDIIEDEENSWHAVVVEEDDLNWQEGGVENIFCGRRGGRIIFRGLLTNESYSEDYMPFANVRLTFNDLLGNLKYEKYYPTNTYESLTNIFAKCFAKTVCSYQLYIQWPFDFGNQERPDEIYLDVSSYFGKTKLEVINDIAESFYWRIYNNYEIQETHAPNGYVYLYAAGSIIVENVGNIASAKQFITYKLAIADSDFTYSYINSTGVSFKTYGIAEDYFKLIERKARYELNRKARYIVATNQYETKDNIIYPDGITKETCVFNDNNDYVYIGMPYAGVVTKVGNEGKLGVKCVFPGETSKYMVKKSASTFEFSCEVWALGNLYYRLILRAYLGSNVYILGRNDNTNALAWHLNELPIGVSHPKLSWPAGSKVYESMSLSGIPQLTAASTDKFYFISATVLNDNLATFYLTNIKITTNPDVPPPLSLKLTTVLSETNRRDIEVSPKFYLLPNISEAQSSYANGIYAFDGTDYTVPTTVVYNNIDQTLLAHLSDVYGENYKNNRWKFNCKAKLIELKEYMTVLNFLAQDIDSTDFIDLYIYDDPSSNSSVVLVENATYGKLINLTAGDAGINLTSIFTFKPLGYNFKNWGVCKVTARGYADGTIDVEIVNATINGVEQDVIAVNFYADRELLNANITPLFRVKKQIEVTTTTAIHYLTVNVIGDYSQGDDVNAFLESVKIEFK